MTLHALQSHHREHLKKIGIPEPPEQLDIHPSEYSEHYANWKRTLPHASDDELHKKVLAHHAWKKHCEPKDVQSQPRRIELRFIAAILGLILLLLIFQPRAHAQFSKINSITTKQGGSSVGFHASPFNINCGANLTCTDDGSTFNLVAGSGATVAWDAILNPTAGGLSIQMFANGNALFTVKRKTDTVPTGSFFDFQNAAGGSLCKLNIDGSLTGCTISAVSQLPVVDVPHGGTGLATLTAHQLYLGNGTSSPTPIPSGTNGQLLQSAGAGVDPGFADPIVSGPDAVAAAPTKNPVQIGCLFLTTPATLTNNQVGAGQCDSVQNLLVKLNAALPAGTNVIGHVIADSGSTTAVTGNVAVTKADGSDVTLGAKADAKSTATDTTAVTIMQVMKEISAMEQAPASRAVTNAGTFAVQIAANSSVNIAQVNGQTTTTTDNGTQAVAPIVTTSSTAATSACNILSAASTNATSCKGSAGNFYGYEIYNTTTTIYYLRLYNTAAAPTCSSATGFIRTIPIQPAGAAGGAGGSISNQVFPVNYGTGIGFCITSGSSSTDNTNAAAGIFGEIRYK